MDRDAGRSDQPADEAAARRVVAAQEHVDGEDQCGGQDQPAGGAQDEGGVHGRSFFAPRRSPVMTAAAAIAARPSTVISPSVSSARKSTMMTLTRLCPCASGTLVWRK